MDTISIDSVGTCTYVWRWGNSGGAPVFRYLEGAAVLGRSADMLGSITTLAS